MHTVLLSTCMRAGHACIHTHTHTNTFWYRQTLKTHWQNDDVRYIWHLSSVHNSDETHLQRVVNYLLTLLLLYFPESNRCLKWSEKVDYCGPFPRSRHSQHTSLTAAATLPCIEVPCLLTSWLCVQVSIVLHNMYSKYIHTYVCDQVHRAAKCVYLRYIKQYINVLYFCASSVHTHTLQCTHYRMS